MLNYIEIAVILIFGVIFAKDSHTSKDSTAIKLATRIFVVLFFLAIFFIIKNLTVTGAHIYTAILLLGVIGLISERKKITREKQNDDNLKKEISFYRSLSSRDNPKKLAGITRPQPQHYPTANPSEKTLKNSVKAKQPSLSTLSTKKQKFKKLNPLSKNTQLKNIAFNYTNSSGDYTYREVDVKKVDENYVFGYCHSRLQMRTFRLDRIEDDEVIIRDSGEVLNVYDWIVQLYPLPEEY